MKKYAQWGFLITLSAILTANLAFVGGAPLRALRKSAGALAFWSLNGLMASVLFLAGEPILGVAFLSIVFAVGLLAEMEEMGFSLAAAGLATLGMVTIVGAASFALWVGSHPGEWMQQLLAVTQPAYDQVLLLKPDLDLSHNALLLQMPGAMVLMLMIAIYVSMLAEGTFSRWLGAEKISETSLSLFKVPDEVIWVLLGSLLAAFYQHDIKILTYAGSNLLMITLGIYFFQGLAVTSHYFNRIKLGMVWRFLAYVILASQLLVLVAMIGVADLWLGFREGHNDKRSKEEIKSENY